MTASTFRPSPPGARASILIAAQGKNLFQRLTDERIALCYDPLNPEPPDLVVFPCGQFRRFTEISADLPEPVRSHVRSGAAGRRSARGRRPAPAASCP